MVVNEFLDIYFLFKLISTYIPTFEIELKLLSFMLGLPP